MPTPTSLPRLPEHLEALLLTFDASWNRPGVDQLRAAYPADADAAYLLELIHIDARKRMAADMTVEEELYLQAFPLLSNDAALLQKVREITFTPLQVGDSVLRALAATTPVLHQVNLHEVDPQATTSEPPSPSKLAEHRYKLEGEIARGGMGAVLRGRDEDLGREIAVKVMLQNHAGKTELLQRFVEEAQIAGQLQHPGITPVYELGRFPDQRPYFTMKLVRGQTLAKLLKDRADPNSERPRFLKIFEQICQTLAYAHTRKVIHRDLKPHNIMVGSFGEVQVMDWGLAKVLTAITRTAVSSDPRSSIPEASEDSVQTKRSSGNSTDIPNTQAGSVLGTPAYMAPEQARGDIDQLDERADVFGLGAILCEILTGKPPYVGESGLDIYRQAVDADLANALERLERCGVDAELIGLTKLCLSVNRENRPWNAGTLTKQLTDYLHSVEDRLKQAELTAVKATTKAEEESKRRRVTFRLAAGILLTLLAGLAGSVWQMKRAMDAEELAKLNEDKAITQSNRVIEKQKELRELIDNWFTQVSESKEMKDTPNTQPLRRSLLQRAKDYYEKAVQEQGDSDEMLVEQAASAYRLAHIINEMSPGKQGLAAFEQSVQLQNKLLARDPHNIKAASVLAESYKGIGIIRFQSGDIKGSQTQFEKAISIKTQLAQANTSDPSFKQQLAMTLHDYGVMLRDAGELTQAMKALQEALLHSEQLVKDHPAVPMYTHEYGLVQHNIGMVLFMQRNTKEAQKVFEQALAIEERLVRENPKVHRYASDLADTLSSMCVIHHGTGKINDSLAFCHRAIEIKKRLVQDHPSEVDPILRTTGSHQ